MNELRPGQWVVTLRDLVISNRSPAWCRRWSAETGENTLPAGAIGFVNNGPVALKGRLLITFPCEPPISLRLRMGDVSAVTVTDLIVEHELIPRRVSPARWTRYMLALLPALLPKLSAREDLRFTARADQEVIARSNAEVAERQRLSALSTDRRRHPRPRSFR